LLLIDTPPQAEQASMATARVAEVEGSLFRRVRVGGAIRESGLSHQAIRTIVKSRAKVAGVGGQISGHSLQVASTQSLAAAGAFPVEMQQVGQLGITYHAGALRSSLPVGGRWRDEVLGCRVVECEGPKGPISVPTGSCKRRRTRADDELRRFPCGGEV